MSGRRPYSERAHVPVAQRASLVGLVSRPSEEIPRRPVQARLASELGVVLITTCLESVIKRAAPLSFVREVRMVPRARSVDRPPMRVPTILLKRYGAESFQRFWFMYPTDEPGSIAWQDPAGVAERCVEAAKSILVKTDLYNANTNIFTGGEICSAIDCQARLAEVAATPDHPNFTQAEQLRNKTLAVVHKFASLTQLGLGMTTVGSYEEFLPGRQQLERVKPQGVRP